jgi:hypothetical protein
MLRINTTICVGLAMVLLSLITSCYQAPDFINPVYDCDCGEVEFREQTFSLKMAEAVIADSTEELSRTYHIVAEMRSENEVIAHQEGHDLTFYLDFEQVGDGVFYIPQDSVIHLVQEINHSDNQFPVRDYLASVGTIEINVAEAGGEETVSFEMDLLERVNGDLVGFTIPFSRSFSVFID